MYCNRILVGSCGATFEVVLFEKRDAFPARKYGLLNMMQLL